MKLPSIYSYGQLFAYSGIEGENSYSDDFMGMLMEEPLSIRFGNKDWIKLNIKTAKLPEKAIILSDFIEVNENNFFCRLVFFDKYTVIGESTILPETEYKNKYLQTNLKGVIRFSLGDTSFFLAVKKQDEKFKFVFRKAEKNEFTEEKCIQYFYCDIERAAKEKLDYYSKISQCKISDYESLYYKCLSVNKVNVYSPQNGIECRWTTPDRIPHRHMWLWDSCFHSMAFADYNIIMAKEAIRAVFYTQREDGFIAHMMEGRKISDITQPQVIAWAVWYIYNKDKDKNFLAECALPLKRYLLWDKNNRDKNNNLLLEWHTNNDSKHCRCDESGMDNSPRFDVNEPLDAVDFSTFMAHDCACLAKIYDALGEKKEAAFFIKYSNQLKRQINKLLWNEKEKIYCDRTLSGRLTDIKSCVGFLPMFAALCSKKRAKQMLKVLKDKTKFRTAFPVPSLSKDNPLFDYDMWRGCTWINYNYFIVKGLRNYGFFEEAESLKELTLKTVNEWYQKTGNIFEFYDCENSINPFHLKRKGIPPQKPDFLQHVHSITDYNWTASFIMMLIQE